MVYMQPRANLSSVGRQPFRPGQWMGFRGVSKNTTYVQNNFFGGAYGGYYDSALNYNTSSCCDGGGMSKGMKWLMGLGVGTTLLGGILSLFKKDKNEEAGGPPVTPQTDSDRMKSLEEEINKLKRQLQETPSTTPTPETDPTIATTRQEDVHEQQPVYAPEPEPEPESENLYKDFGVNGLVCRDASGKTRNITGAAGQVTITKAGTAGGPPQEFTITDTTENANGNTYTYKLTGTTADGKPIYSCISKNGQAISSGNEYTYENGELVQYEGSGYGKGLKTDAELSSASTASTASTATVSSQTSTQSTQNSQNQDPIDTIRNTVSTNKMLSPERKMEITDLAEQIQNSNLDDTTKSNLLSKLDNMSHGMTLANDAVFINTKTTIESTLNKAKTNASLPEDAKNWNKSHPDQQVSVTTVNGKTQYSTTAKIQTKFGIQKHTVNGSSIEDLGRQIAELKKKAAAADSRPVGSSYNGYADLGKAMQ